MSSVFCLCLLFSAVCLAADEENDLKTKVPQSTGPERIKAWWEDVESVIGDLTIDWTVIGQGQLRNGPTLDGENYVSRMGGTAQADMYLTWNPLNIPGGTFEFWALWGHWDGVTDDVDDVLFSSIAQIVGDNTSDSHPIDVHYLMYTQSFFDDLFFITAGQTEPEYWLDGTAYTSDYATQFVTGALNQNPMFDSEDENAPLLAVGVNPLEELQLVAMVQSSSWGNGVKEKDIYDEWLDSPTFAAGITYSPKIGQRQGNYQVYGWAATYEHEKLEGDGTEEGWGVAFVMDQELTEKFGVFLRASYANEAVYAAPWFWSVGGQYTGLIPSRENDTLGVGVAGSIASEDLDGADSMETTMEAYYRIEVCDYFAISPDIAYIVNPGGDDDNDGIVSGTLRAVVTF